MDYFEKKWVGQAMGNETIYWDGLISGLICLICLRRGDRECIRRNVVQRSGNQAYSSAYF